MNEEKKLGTWMRNYLVRQRLTKRNNCSLYTRGQNKRKKNEQIKQIKALKKGLLFLFVHFFLLSGELENVCKEKHEAFSVYLGFTRVDFFYCCFI